jgi:hypothetical protein
LDINNANISWSINGKNTQSGTGLTTLEVNAPALGGRLSVRVSATTPEGTTVSSSIVVTSGSIDLIIESDGETHDFFKGKISPTYQSKTKIIAIPHISNSKGGEYDPKNLVYKWEKGDRVIEDQSGFGRQSLTVTGDTIPRPYEITVTASTRDGSFKTQTKTSIESNEPSISFYINDPLYGPLFNKVISSTIRIGSQKETGILAIPYGLNNSSSGFEYEWKINNIPKPDLSTGPYIIIRAPDQGSGSSNISLDIRNPDKMLQGVSGEVTATFTENTK